MKKQSLFSDETLQKIQKTRKLFLKFAVWIIIAELIFGAILILTGSWNIPLAKIQGTFLILALIMLVSVNNFLRIEKGNRTIQVLALIGFISNLIWGIFALLLTWEIVQFYWVEEILRTNLSGYTYTYTAHHMTSWARIMTISAFTAAGSFFISNTMSIEETIKPVKPLKITAILCATYLWAFGTGMILFEPEYQDVEKLVQLAVLAGSAFVITALAASIVSKTNREKSTEKLARPAPKTEAELRAEIEEKVRREMIEKEIRAKIAAEQADSGDTSSDNKS